jgi:NDP-sugar pyrophosphorylase family protein
VIPTKAFVLCAGLGTRFKPQSLYCPKPALSFFNLPQALYSTASLKEIGVTDFYYNSHHLPDKLEKSLKPYFKNKSFFEKELLDSAGGLSNASEVFKNEEHFWVINGDSLIRYQNTEFLHEAYNIHKSKGSLATLIGISNKKPGINGLSFDSSNNFRGLSKDDNSIHFIGLYLLNTEMFKYLSKKPLKLFGDVLLKDEIMNRVSVYQAPPSVVWYETGNEADFISAHKNEAKSIIKDLEHSFVYRTHENWDEGKDLTQRLERFLKERNWGLNEYSAKEKSEFICIPENCNIHKDVNLKNSTLQSGLTIEEPLNFKDRVLVHPSQWR